MLAIETSHEQTDWDLYIPFKVFAYRTSVHADTSFTPFELMYGTVPNAPIDIILSTPTEEKAQLETTYADYLQQLKSTIKIARQQALQNLSDKRIDRTKYYNKNRLLSTYKVGDLVYLSTERVSPGPGLTPKLAPLWKGPYKISEVHQKNNVTLITDNDPNFSYRVNISRIRPAIIPELTPHITESGEIVLPSTSIAPSSSLPSTLPSSTTSQTLPTTSSSSSSSSSSSTSSAIPVRSSLTSRKQTIQSQPGPSYDIEYIMDHKVEENVNFYLIKWQGYSKRSATWEPEDNFNSYEAIDEFWLLKQRSSAAQQPLQQQPQQQPTKRSKRQRQKQPRS